MPSLDVTLQPTLVASDDTFQAAAMGGSPRLVFEVGREYDEDDELIAEAIFSNYNDNLLFEVDGGGTLVGRLSAERGVAETIYLDDASLALEWVGDRATLRAVSTTSQAQLEALELRVETLEALVAEVYALLINKTLPAQIYIDTDTFLAAEVRVDALVAPHHVDSEAFGAAAITQVSLQVIEPLLTIDEEVFQAATIHLQITASYMVDADSFYGQTLAGEQQDQTLTQSATFAADETFHSAFIGEIGDLGTLAVWFTAHDNAHMTVNIDGTGGAPADGGLAGRLLDRSGNNNHVSALTDGSRSMWRAGHGLNFQWLTDNNASYMRSSLATTIPRQDCSGGMIVWGYGEDIPLIDFGTANAAPNTGFAVFQQKGSSELRVHTGAAFLNSGLLHSARRMVITWRSNATELILRVNGEEHSFGPISAQTMNELCLSTFDGGLPVPHRLFETVVYSDDIGATNMGTLESYLRVQAGNFDPTRTVAVYGDSLSVGTGASGYKCWQDYVTSHAGSKWYSFVGGGLFIYAPHISAANLAALKGSNEGVVVMRIGTNDILIGRTGVQCETDIGNYCTTLKAAGNKVIICTLQHFLTNNAERIVCNSRLKANWRNYADALVLLDEAPELSDCTDTEYFLPDQVHQTDAGYAVAGELIDRALRGEKLVSPDNMTGENMPAPYVASASSMWSFGYDAYRAFNADPTYFWASGQAPGDLLPEWIQIDLGVEHSIARYTLTARSPAAIHGWIDWTLKASNDTVNWVTVDTRTDQATWSGGEMRAFDVGNRSSGRYWRFEITESMSGGTGVGRAEVDLIKLFGTPT